MGGRACQAVWIQLQRSARIVGLGLTLACTATEPLPPLPESLQRLPNVARLLDRAQEGDAKAQASLGDYCYSLADYTNAVLWYKVAAHNGNANARTSLAHCYRAGRGVPKDAAAAAHWSRLALIQRAPTAPATPGTPEEPPAEPVDASPPASELPAPANPAEGGAPERARELTQAESRGAGAGDAPPVPSPTITRDQATPDRLAQERERLIQAWLQALEGPVSCSQRARVLQPPKSELMEVSLKPKSYSAPSVKPTP